MPPADKVYYRHQTTKTHTKTCITRPALVLIRHHVGVVLSVVEVYQPSNISVINSNTMAASSLRASANPYDPLKRTFPGRKSLYLSPRFSFIMKFFISLLSQTQWSSSILVSMAGSGASGNQPWRHLHLKRAMQQSFSVLVKTSGPDSLSTGTLGSNRSACKGLALVS